MELTVPQFTSGVHNLLNSEIIPEDAAKDSLNWYTQDGKIILIAGKVAVGTIGAAGNVTAEHFGYKTDGTKVHYRKIGAIIQYFDGTTWQNIITGLTSTADYACANYSSLAGAFTFFFGVDGIYKVNNAQPASYISMYDSTKNFKGKAFIDKGRTILWGRAEDKTGLYGSWIDTQKAVSGGTGTYTAVAAEATTSLGGTLGFKGANPKANCFAVQITITASGEVYTDNYLGVLTGSLGGTGTINYTTGVYTLSNPGVGTANYQWEDSNVRGVTDFSKSATRIAGEGFVFPQDEGGDEILNVVIGQDGTYFSMKRNSVYQLSIDSTDLNATNDIYRKQIGTQSYRGSISTVFGIVFMNTSNQSKPEMTILQRDITGTVIEPKVLFKHFNFANYLYDDATIMTYDRYFLIFCKTPTAVSNDTILMCSLKDNTVDITNYEARTGVTDGTSLYVGSSSTQTVYKLFSGFDDDGFAIKNYWIGRDETYKKVANSLKKLRKIRLDGHISIDQSYGVYLSYDNLDFQLVGTVLGSASYVDSTNPQTIGSDYIGSARIAGDATTDIFPYLMEIKLRKVPKFRKCTVKFVALGVGYCDISSRVDKDIFVYEDRLPAHYREKQNVSLDGTTNNNPNPL